MSSAKARNPILIGSIIAIFANFLIGVFLPIQTISASIGNQAYSSSSTTIPIASKSFYLENTTVSGQNPINATHVQVSHSGNGTLARSNNTESIAVSSTGCALVNFGSS
ncbi:MAG: hypothetical protein ACJ707_08400 [Nitrososphaera sp.]